MPLVFVILAITLMIVVSKERNEERNRIKAYVKNASRMTNAELERQAVDYYMKSGFELNAAYRMAQQDMVARGFEPCIPKDAYGYCPGYRIGENCETSYVHDPYKYDSDEVKRRRRIAKENGYNPNSIYDNFPQTQEEYLEALRSNVFELQKIPIGSLVVHPEYGTCEVTGYNDRWYILKILHNDKIVTDTKIGDPLLKPIRR